ncbi:MAG: ester cyclase [Candidatus Promineifilaceae bacterium]|nr:ester cyclase [Candidatus Promineifilaceae bacterium]
MSTTENKETARQLIEEVFNGRNIDRVDELIAADFVEHEELPPGVPAGREGTKAAAAMLHSAFPDFKAMIEDVVAEDDKVVLRMTWSGSQQNEFMGLPPSGKSFSVNVIDIFRVAGSQIVEHWGTIDMMGMMQQLGAMPEPE